MKYCGNCLIDIDDDNPHDEKWCILIRMLRRIAEAIEFLANNESDW